MWLLIWEETGAVGGSVSLGFVTVFTVERYCNLRNRLMFYLSDEMGGSRGRWHGGQQHAQALSARSDCFMRPLPGLRTPLAQKEEGPHLVYLIIRHWNHTPLIM